MSITRIVVFIVLFFSSALALAQKKEAYLLFKNGNESECPVASMTNKSGDWKADYKQTDRYDKGNFIICRQYFKIKKNSLVEEIAEGKIDTSKIRDISNFMHEGFINDKNEVTRPNKIFGKIYILENTGNGTFLKFEVEWTETTVN